MTRAPFSRDSARFSAPLFFQTVPRTKVVSPSFHSLLARSKYRSVDAMVTDATAVPDWVKRSAGSSVRLPTTVMAVVMLIADAFLRVRPGWGVAGAAGLVVVTGHRISPRVL